METCTVETGLLKKKPCGEKATTRCGNCEQPICAKHAKAEMSGGKRTFLCPECARAWKESEKTLGALPPTPAAAAPPPAEKKPAPEKPAPAPKPAAAAKPAEKKPEPPPVEHSGPLEFTPEPKKPEDKK